MTSEQIKTDISNAIKAFISGILTNNSMNLFQTLGYNTQRSAHLSKPDYKTFRESYLSTNTNFNEAKAFTSDWKYIDLLFQLSKSEVSKQTTLFDTIKVDNTLIETYLFFTIELTGDHYTRGNLSSITREVNKIFPMPVMILFRHNNSLTLSVINRRIHKRDESKDVLEKVTLIKDIDIVNPHRAHIEILFDLSFEQLKFKHNFTNFVELHDAWQKTLDTKELNKKFFQELANWYFWAISKTSWPDDDEQLKKKDVRNATNVIRLITRLIFIWFLKEKKLVADILFNEKELKSILNYSDENDSTYYKAILQNLFFATLNTPLDKRTFRTKRNFQGKNSDRGNPFVFRYENYFIKDITELYEHIPFLNGGLFDCLDYKDDDNKMVHIDGFSEEKDNPLKVPDKLFFSKPTTIDLSNIYNDKKKSKSDVRGLINILDSYKFTITENTPIEEEVALDPELLGRVFENLLAYYNPETETTARKQTGSFYTPREIVNYMVDESLIAYLKTKMLAESFSYLEIGSDQMDLLGKKSRKGQLKIEEDVNPNPWIGKEEDLENEIRNLLSYSEAELNFNIGEKKALVKAIDNIKILDPACGSGAFPMGMLHKLVHILHRLDPQNQLWKKKQVEFASQIQEPTARENALKNIEDVFNPENNYADYGRKLFLIRNCIYGVDIQPIAIQIAKLRFFISLLIDQSINNQKDNHNIDPLPNLESKFVAANTLIGLQKSTSTGNLFDENYDKIMQLKSKFEEIRKKYFNVRLPQEKKKLHDDYLKTRDELIKILKKDKGYSVDAPLLVQYDPYNPLNVSPFFDTEWMFGFLGFDIIIGNPPYVSYYSNTGSSLSAQERKYFVNNYKSVLKTSDRINSMNLMTERGLHLLKTEGHLSFITNKTIAVLPSYIEVRKFILNNSKITYLVTDLDPFEAIVDCVVFGLNKKDDKEYDIKWLKGGIGSFNYQSTNTILSNPKLELHFSPHKNLLNKIERAKNKLSDILIINRGVNIGGCFDDFLSHTKKSKAYWKYLSGTKNIQRYTFDWVESDGYMKFDLNLEQELREQGYTLVLGNKDRYMQERLFIPESSQYLMAAFCNEEYYSAYGIMVGTNTNAKNSIKYPCALLNSKLFTFYAVEREILRKGKKATPHIGVKGLDSIPVHLCDKSTENKFISLVDKIISIKKSINGADTSKLEKQIDEMVYKLYDLTEEEIKIIEGTNE